MADKVVWNEEAGVDELWVDDGDTYSRKVTAATSAPSGNTSIDVVKIAGTNTAAGAGSVSLGTQRVTLASDDPSVALLTNINTALAVIDDWDESDRAKVNLIVGQAGVQGASGTVSNNTQRVVLATDVGLPAGTNNIGDVDVLSVPQSIRGPAEPTIDSYAHAAISVAANATDSVLINSPGANKQLWIYGLFGTADTADGTVSFQDSDNTAITGVMKLINGGGFCAPPSGNFSMPWAKLATDKAFEMDTVTCGFKGIVSYAIVSV